MAAQGTSTAEPREPRSQREQDTKPELVVVQLGKRHSRKQIKRLRKGQGKLVGRVEDIVDELTRAGTVKAGAQPVVIVVREKTPLPWPLSSVNS